MKSDKTKPKNQKNIPKSSPIFQSGSIDVVSVSAGRGHILSNHCLEDSSSCFYSKTIFSEMEVKSERGDLLVTL